MVNALKTAGAVVIFLIAGVLVVVWKSGALPDFLVSKLDTRQRAASAYDKGDYVKARKLYLKLAEHGNAEEAHTVAEMYEQGKGGPVDGVQALRWYRVAAEAGDPASQDYLGVAYYQGLSGLAQNYPEAFHWIRSAAMQKWQHAQFNLGVLYAEGRGVAQDQVEAQKWFILAGDAGTRNRKIFDGILTPEQNAEAAKRAKEWRVTKGG